MKVTYYGHSCFGIHVKGKDLLFDPFISPNGLAKKIRVNSIPADYILISHGHEDHVADAENIAKRTGATIISNYEITTWFEKRGVSKFHPMNIGGKWLFDFGTVKYVKAVHSSMLPDGAYGGNPGGFMVETREGNFYYAGDTALTNDMKLLGKQHEIHFAFLPVGDNFTMGADDAVIAAKFIGCRRIIGMHYDTFGFIKIDHELATRTFSEKKRELLLMKIGQSVEIRC